MVDPKYDFVVTEKMLEQLMHYEQVRVKDNIFAEADFDLDFNSWIVRLHESVLAEKLVSETYSDYHIMSTPETTFQMFKATNANKWWLRWFVNRYPVRYHVDKFEVEIQLDRYFKYPDATIELPRLGKPVKYEQITRIR